MFTLCVGPARVVGPCRLEGGRIALAVFDIVAGGKRYRPAGGVTVCELELK